MYTCCPLVVVCTVIPDSHLPMLAGNEDIKHVLQLSVPSSKWYPAGSSPASFTLLIICVYVCAFSGKRTFLTRTSLLYSALQHGRACKLTLLVTDQCQDQSSDLCHLLQCKGLPVPSSLACLAEQKVCCCVTLCVTVGGWIAAMFLSTAQALSRKQTQLCLFLKAFGCCK